MDAVLSRPSGTTGTDPALTAFLSAQEYVKNKLKALATAQFSKIGDPRTGYRTLGSGKYFTTGYVDAQNGFGALIRSDWVVILEDSSDSNYRVLFLKIGDQTVGDSSEYLRALEAEATTTPDASR